MSDPGELLSAADLDEMSPTERAQVIRDRIITDLDGLPAEFRSRVERSARRLASDLTQPAPE